VNVKIDDSLQLREAQSRKGEKEEERAHGP
jgi:hypothetical protein